MKIFYASIFFHSVATGVGTYMWKVNTAQCPWCHMQWHTQCDPHNDTKGTTHTMTRNDTNTNTHTNIHKNIHMTNNTHLHIQWHAFTHKLPHKLAYTYDNKHTQHIIAYVSLCVIVWEIVSVYYFFCFYIICFITSVVSYS